MLRNAWTTSTSAQKVLETRVTFTITEGKIIISAVNVTTLVC